MGIPIFIDWLKLYKVIKSNKNDNFRPNIIHCYSVDSIPLGLMISKYYASDLVWTCHGPWEINKKIKRFFLSVLVKKIVAITPEIYALIKGSNKCIIPLGINDDIKYENNKDYLSCNHKIVCIARFQNIKGQDILLRAYKIISEKLPNTELHFYGGFLSDDKSEVNFYNELKSYVEKNLVNKKVYFHDFKPNIREFMADYNLLCIPSRYESFSITALEGLNRGMYIVAPNVGGPKYIIQNGRSGVLFESGNAIDLAGKCIDVLLKKISLDRNEIVKRGKEFSIDKQASSLKKIY